MEHIRRKNHGETGRAVIMQASSGRVNTQFIIKTKSKYIAFGHKWNDCHYPNSLWKEGGINDYNKRLIE